MGDPSRRMRAGSAVAALLGALFVAGAAPPERRPPAADPGAGAKLARVHCASCHLVPPADVLPRSAWRASMEKMALLSEGRPMPGWGEPRPAVTLSAEYEHILAHYEARAPAVLPTPEPWPAADQPARFVRSGVAFPDALTPEPAISNVRLADLDGDGRPELLATDMRQGALLLVSATGDTRTAAALAAVPNPSHVSPVDLDRDGRQDLLVADLGQFFPGDHEKGAVVWLRAVGRGGFAAHRFEGFARPADAEAADFDGDGRLDVVVAAFGWWRTGNLTLMLNRTDDWSRPAFDRRVLDQRPGFIHAAPADLDGDGKRDVVALVAQQYEEVVAYLGDGKGGFRAQTLYRAPHPNWGSTGMALVDLDRDGDEDVVMTNGDMFDDDILKPYHGILWLENKGGAGGPRQPPRLEAAALPPQ